MSDKQVALWVRIDDLSSAYDGASWYVLPWGPVQAARVRDLGESCRRMQTLIPFAAPLVALTFEWSEGVWLRNEPSFEAADEGSPDELLAIGDVSFDVSTRDYAAAPDREYTRIEGVRIVVSLLQDKVRFTVRGYDHYSGEVVQTDLVELDEVSDTVGSPEALGKD